jgi:hypothetical protein
MIRHVLTALALLAAAGPLAAADKFDDLTPLLPANVNAAVVCDVPLIYDSPLARREKWATDKPLPLPPSLNTVALAARLGPDGLSGGRWEVGAARLRVRLSMAEIARREKGALDTVAGAEAVLSPRNAYFVALRPPWVIGMMAPADRQELAHWVRDVRSATGAVLLPPFLRDSVTGVDRSTQFVLAIDLADAAHPEAVRRHLAAAPALAGKGLNLDALAKLIADIRGVKLTVTVTDVIRGELRAEFGAPAGALAAVAGPLLTEYLAEHGACLEALEDWKAEAVGNAVVFRGELPEKGFRRVLSLVTPPPPPVGAGDAEGAAPLAAEIRLLATKYYYRSVMGYLDDLRRPSRQTQQNFPRFATWYESFAEKIEQLPAFNVDEDLVKYGRGVAQRLRAIAASLHGDFVDVTRLEQSIRVTPYVYAFSGWGGLRPGVWLESNEAQVRAQQQQAIERGAQARQELWSNVENATDEIRRKMAERYSGAI